MLLGYRMSHNTTRLLGRNIPFTSILTKHSTRNSSTNSQIFQSQPAAATMYDNKTFASTSNTPNGEVSAATTFHYHQANDVVWAAYAGGSIVRGSLIAKVLNQAGELDMRYHHINVEGELMTGRCRSTPEVLEDGRIRLHERWKWTSGDCSEGTSVVEEVRSG